MAANPQQAAATGNQQFLPETYTAVEIAEWDELLEGHKIFHAPKPDDGTVAQAERIQARLGAPLQPQVAGLPGWWQFVPEWCDPNPAWRPAFLSAADARVKDRI